MILALPFRRPGRLLLPAALALLTALAAAAAVEPAEEARAYRLAAGDTILVEVFGEDDLTTRTSLSDRGTITFPFLGELAISGLTPREVGLLIDERLRGPYLVDPRVTVTVAEYRPVFLNGEVRRPGSFPWQPGMTVRKAVALAGGLAERASTRRIFLLPEGGDPEEDRRKVDFDHPIRPGAIVTVEQSFF